MIMNNTLIYILSFITLLAFMQSCNNKSTETTEKQFIETEFKKEEGTITFKPENYRNEEIVFYNLFSPVELTYLVSKKEAFYNSALLNPLNNITKYNTSNKVALNLGIYGADISYLWMFDQQQQALSYRAAIQRLTDQLEIPREMVNFTYESAEANSQNFDSLVQIAKVSYLHTDKHLKETGRQHSASLVLLGGWIETLYIAIHMYENPSTKLLGKIAIQKYSVNSLISLLQLSQNQSDISEYLLLLRRLKKAFDELDVQFPAESLVIDTSMKHIKLNDHNHPNLKPSQFSDIKRITRLIRAHIIE